MSELVFPVTVALLVYVVAVPLLTLLADFVLRQLRRRVRHAADFGALSVWALLVAPLVVPLVWVFSGALHQFDGHHAVAACIQAHAESHCAEAVVLALLLLLPLIVVAARRRGTDAPRATDSISGVPLARRSGVDGLVCTRGILRPIIELDESLSSALSGPELDAVLGHEVAHAENRDPLLYWLLRLALSLNPAGALLARHAAGWELGREVRCDLRAVSRGADRFVLAQALVRVAAAVRRPTPHCGFIGPLDKLELRVRVLCADEIPKLHADQSVAPLVLFILALLASHQTEHGLIDWLHHASEKFWFTHFL